MSDGGRRRLKVGLGEEVSNPPKGPGGRDVLRHNVPSSMGSPLSSKPNGPGFRAPGNATSRSTSALKSSKYTSATHDWSGRIPSKLGTNVNVFHRSRSTARRALEDEPPRSSKRETTSTEQW